MRQAVSVLMLLLVVGCATAPSSQDPPPDITDFPKQELTYRVRGSVDGVVQDIQDTLTRRNVRATPPMLRAPNVVVVSAYVTEPAGAADRRIRRTAFRFTITAMAASGSSGTCSTVAVASLTQSKGNFEERWSIQESDKTFASSAWQTVQREITAKECK